jgi:hypothetical protein
MTDLAPTHDLEKQMNQSTDEIAQDQESEASRHFRHWFIALRRRHMIMDTLLAIIVVVTFTISIVVVVKLCQNAALQGFKHINLTKKQLVALAQGLRVRVTPDMLTRRAVVARCGESCWEDVGKTGTIF